MQGESMGSIAALLKSIEAAQNPEQAILKLILGRVEERDSALADAIRYCAIPRRFDSEILGVLRQAPDDREANDRLLQDLTSYSFVRAQSDGGYSYDHTTRDLLIDEWKQKQPDRFDQLSELLVAYYQKQFERTSELGQDLMAVSGVIQTANQSRYLQLASAAETKVVVPLLEALYHETQRSAEAGYKLFQRYYDQFENQNRQTMSESILAATRGYLESLPPESGRGKWLRWLQYWKARQEITLRRFGEAEKLLQPLLEKLEGISKTASQSDEEIKLRLWVLGDLGYARQEEWKIRDAIEAFRSAITLAKETNKDPYNLPLWHYRLAGLYFSLDEMEQAAEEYREAIKNARDQNLRLEIYSRLDLSAVLLGSSLPTEAFQVALEALHSARTAFPEDIATHRFVNQQFMSFFSRENPTLLDSLFAEGQALLTESGDVQSQLQFRRQYVTALRQSGQLRRAEEELLRLEENVSDDQRYKASLLLEKALLREEQGRLNEVMSTYDELAKKAKGSRLVWDYAAALSNRGMAHSKLANWQASEIDLQNAIALWEEVGYQKLAAFVRIPLATAFRKQGDLSRADEILKTVINLLGDTKTGYLAEYHRERGDLLRDQASTDSSREQYERCLAIYSALGEPEHAARVLGELASLAADQGNWEHARQHTFDAFTRWKKLAELDNYRRTETSEKADQLNAHGMKLFSAGGNDRPERVKRAAAEFGSACKLVPRNFWFQLNRAYACAELKEWPEAIEAVEAALSCCPSDLRPTVLYERLSEYRASQGQRIVDAGDHAEAARFYAESKRHLAGKIAVDRQAVLSLGLGDSFLRLSESQKAEDEYRQGLANLGDSNFTLLKAGLHARVGFTAALRGDLTDAISNFRSSVQLRRQADSEAESAIEDLEKLVSDFTESIVTRPQYQTFLVALQTIIDDASLRASESRDLLAAKFDVIRKRYEAVQGLFAAAALRNVPTAPKVVIEADARLFPQDVETPQVKRMIEIDVPVMLQERIEKTSGVRVPGIVIRSDDNLGTNRYVLTLDEIPLVSGSVFPEKSFYPDFEKCQKAGIKGELVAFPDGFQGLWVGESERNKAEAAGLPGFDAYQYMILHLEIQLRRHLSVFLGIQKVEAIVDQWAALDPEGGDSWRKQIEADSNSLVRLVQVFRQLVDEGVPVRNVDTIVKMFLAVGSNTKDVLSIVAEIRAALKSEFPALLDERQLVALSDHSKAVISGWVRKSDSARFLGIDRNEADRVIEVMSEKILSHDPSKLALVIDDKDLRPFVRRLVETRFPDVPVVSQDEVPGERRMSDERIELVKASGETNGVRV